MYLIFYIRTIKSSIYYSLQRVLISNTLSNDRLYYTIFKLFQNYVRVSVVNKVIFGNFKATLLVNTVFFRQYYRMNNLLWQEGFFIDFAQKKSTDKFLKKFLIFSAYTFSERYVFDRVVKFYTDLIVWFLNQQSIYGFNNIANTITVVVGLISILILTISFIGVSSMYFSFNFF